MSDPSPAVVDTPTRGRPAAGPQAVSDDPASGALSEGAVRVRTRGQIVEVMPSPYDGKR